MLFEEKIMFFSINFNKIKIRKIKKEDYRKIKNPESKFLGFKI